MTAKRTQPDWSFKILLIGDSGVGKTCLMFRFAGIFFIFRSCFSIFYFFL